MRMYLPMCKDMSLGRYSEEYPRKVVIPSALSKLRYGLVKMCISMVPVTLSCYRESGVEGTEFNT